MQKITRCSKQNRFYIRHGKNITIKIVDLHTKVQWIYNKKDAIILLNKNIVSLQKHVKL
jgi:hypothetical protein